MRKLFFIFSLLFIFVLTSCDLVNTDPTSKMYKITFDSDGGTLNESLEVMYGDTISEPVDPVKKGYIFDGWYLENQFETGEVNTTTPFDFDEFIVTSNITFKACYTINNRII